MALTAQDMTGEGWYHSTEEVETLHKLMQELPVAPVVINIGTGRGTSALALLEGRRETVVFSIDVDASDMAHEYWKEAGIPDGCIIAILGRSEQIGQYWPFPVDLVFVDGADDKLGLESDIIAWSGHIKSGGILAFHDYANPDYPHVRQIVDAFMQGREKLLHEGTIIAFQRSIDDNE